jgi:hypothetical protein
MPLHAPPLSVAPLQTGAPHRPRGSGRPAATGRQTPFANPVSDEKQLWQDDVHAVSQQMPETQLSEPQSVDPWQAAPSPSDACARAVVAANARAITAQTPARLDWTAQYTPCAFTIENIRPVSAVVKRTEPSHARRSGLAPSPLARDRGCCDSGAAVRGGLIAPD